MEQFEINRFLKLDLFGLDASFTNSSLFMVLAVVLIVGFLNFAMGGRALIPTRLQSVAELAYEFIANAGNFLSEGFINSFLYVGH